MTYENKAGELVQTIQRLRDDRDPLCWGEWAFFNMGYKNQALLLEFELNAMSSDLYDTQEEIEHAITRQARKILGEISKD